MSHLSVNRNNNDLIAHLQMRNMIIKSLQLKIVVHSSTRGLSY